MSTNGRPRNSRASASNSQAGDRPSHDRTGSSASHPTPTVVHTYESFADIMPSSPPPSSPPRRSWLPQSPIIGSFNRSRRTGWRGSLGGDSLAETDGEPTLPDETSDADAAGEKHLSTLQLVLLTVGLLGAQLTWTVEMA